MHTGMQEPGESFDENFMTGGIIVLTVGRKSYQNAVGSARKVVQLVKSLGFQHFLQAKL